MTTKPARDFLHALAQALSALELYDAGHPARERAVDDAWNALRPMLEPDGDGGERPAPELSFLGNEVVCGERRLFGFEGWEPGQRLAAAGVERLEFGEEASRGELAEFLLRARRLVDRSRAEGEPAVGEDEDPSEGLEGIRFGRLRQDDERDREAGGDREDYELDQEEEAVDWLMEGAREGELSGAVAEAVVRSLSVALHEEQDVLGMLAPMKEADQYTAVHSMNTSLLAMGMAEGLGFAGDQVRRIGEAALLHDAGKTRVPGEILNKEGELTDEEYGRVQRHPVDGARLLLDSGPEMELAAVVAYEHHMRWDGGGYPEPLFDRRPHPVSRIVQVCDIYDSLRTARPYRDPWEPEKILDYMEERAGSEFCPDAVDAFVLMMRERDAGTAGDGERRASLSRAARSA